MTSALFLPPPTEKIRLSHHRSSYGRNIFFVVLWTTAKCASYPNYSLGSLCWYNSRGFFSSLSLPRFLLVGTPLPKYPLAYLPLTTESLAFSDGSKGLQESLNTAMARAPHSLLPFSPSSLFEYVCRLKNVFDKMIYFFGNHLLYH